jgi:hypothetical protein
VLLGEAGFETKVETGLRLGSALVQREDVPERAALIPSADGPDGEDGSGIRGVGYIGRKFFASKLWASTGVGPFIGAHPQSLKDFPPSQGADTLSLHRALERAQAMMENPHGSSN